MESPISDDDMALAPDASLAPTAKRGGRRARPGPYVANPVYGTPQVVVCTYTIV